MSFKELLRLHVRAIVSFVRDARTVLNFGLAVLVVGLLVNYAHATTPNPGHPWTDIGDGVFQVADTQTAVRTYTFPDANATVLTSNAAVTVAQGGTGLATFGGTNTVLYTSAAGTLTNVAASAAAGQFLQTTASGGVPTWATILGVANGGTGLSSITANNLIYGNGTSAASLLAPGATTGAVLMNTVSGAPSWSLLSALPSTAGLLPVANGGTNSNATPTAGGVGYGTGTAHAYTAAGSAGQIIESAGAGTPTWTTATYPTTAGTSGNVLMSNGTNWNSTAAAGILVDKKYLTTGTSYTPTTGVTKVFLQIVGGGGAGGGVSATASGAGGGGGAGGYTEKTIAVTNTAYTYSLGAGGTGSSGAAGGNGGATTITIGSAISANGGTGGSFIAGSTVNKYAAGGAGGTAGSGGDVMVAGQPGEAGSTFSSAVLESSGNGGSSLFGGGGRGQVNATAAGIAATGNGAGGGGASAIVATASAGGAGTAGIIVVWEYK